MFEKKRLDVKVVRAMRQEAEDYLKRSGKEYLMCVV